MPSRFVLVAPNFHPRICGVADYSVRLALELRRRGHDALILSREPAEPHPEAPEVPIAAVPGKTPRAVCRGIIDRVVTARPDRVLLQYVPWMWGASRFGSGAVPGLVRDLQARSIPVTMVAHEIFIPWSMRPDLAIAAALQRMQLAVMLRRADRSVITTTSRERDIAPLLALSGARSPATIPVGAGAVPAPRATDPGRQRLGMFSTLSKGKQVEVVLEAFAYIGAELPRAELVLVGDFSQDPARLQRLLAQLAAHPHAARIRVTGKLPLARVAEEVAALDVFLFPMAAGATTRSSTLPLALGTGIPVVATRGNETDERVFRAEENMVFADALTGEALAAAALRVLREPALAARIGDGGHRLYRERFSWEKIVDRYLEDVPSNSELE